MNKVPTFDIDAFRNACVNAVVDAMQKDILPEFNRIAKEEVRQGHPQGKKFGDDVANHMEVGRVEVNGGVVTGYIQLENGTPLNTQVRAAVLEEGNNHNGPLYTEPGKTSWDADLKSQKKQNHTLRGRAVVWVYNTNYPNAKRTIYNKKTGKSYTVTMSKFYPLFRRTYLPDKFNHPAQNLIGNAQKRLATRKTEFIEPIQSKIAAAIPSCVK